MKKIFLLMAMLFVMTSCEKSNITEETAQTQDENKITVIDTLGNEVSIKETPKNVVALGSSITEIWLLAEGELIGTTEDSFDRFEFENVSNVGTLKEPNLEEIMKNTPELVLMTSSISGQTEIEPALKKANIDVLYCDVNSFEDYLYVLDMFTKINETENLYETNGISVSEEIENYKNKAVDFEEKTGLFFRTSATNFKALPSDNFAVKIMEDMGIRNIANDSILDDLSIEAILKEDPYYIFIVVMGDEEELAMEQYEAFIKENPAFETLNAVKENRVIVLPKELFHNKPNNRWGEAYGYMYEIRQEKE